MSRSSVGVAAGVVSSFAVLSCASTPIVSGPLNPQIPVSEPFADAAFESVCHLNIRRREWLVRRTVYSGTAVLYRGRYLLTAGHNVYKDWSGISGVDVRCGAANARGAPVDETIQQWQAIDAAGYFGRGFARDFGVIRLNRPVAVTQAFELASTPARAGEAIRLAGYPAWPLSGGYDLFEAQGAITAVAGGVAYYDVETFRSNSGGPVWREAGGAPELVAIHVTNSGGRAVDADYIAEVERLIGVLDGRAAERGFGP